MSFVMVNFQAGNHCMSEMPSMSLTMEAENWRLHDEKKAIVNMLNQ